MSIVLIIVLEAKPSRRFWVILVRERRVGVPAWY